MYTYYVVWGDMKTFIGTSASELVGVVEKHSGLY